uniref:Methyltransferase n=1 Tax=viral metagenome TaxID=1070528 RepID=A0A6C0E135_9ZZZZ
MLLQNKSVSYNDFHEKGCGALKEFEYTGKVYRTAYFWTDVVKLNGQKEIKYLEIGAFQGANALTFWKLYCENTSGKSEIHLVDPWISYNDYNEYANEQSSNYKNLLSNISRAPEACISSFYIHRGFSYDKLLNFNNDYFDIIYIDGNHKPEYVIEDAVLSFRKLKRHGYMIFDDYGWEEVHVGVDAFLTAYKDKVKILGCQNCQVFLQKLM